MKYRTVIELVCDADGKDEALNLAGEYLRGAVEYGVDMKARTDKLWSHNFKKYAISSIIVLVMFLTMSIKISPLGSFMANRADSSRPVVSTYTMMPVLKTQYRSDFKKEWSDKKHEAVMEFIKK